MIRINCTNCRAQLTIDDAFAGGVCRCQFCGTIQTVPAHLKNNASAEGSPSDTISHAAGNGGGSKTLFQNKSRVASRAGSGLDDLANIVASSGLSGSGLANRASTRPPKAAATGNRSLLPILIGGGAVILVLVGVIIYLATRSTGTSTTETPATVSPTPGVSTPGSVSSPITAHVDNSHPTVSTPNNPPANVTPAPTGGPIFLGAKITGQSIVYLIDRGQGTKDSFDGLKQACLTSLATLGPDRKFAVIFWDNGTEEAAFPKQGTVPATPQNIDACSKSIDDIFYARQSDVRPALKKALALHPDVVLLATGKSLNPEFADQVLGERKGSSARIDCFYVGQSDSDGIMKKITSATGGQSLEISIKDLKTY